MASYEDLREYLKALEQAAKLKRIAQPINKDTELHPLVRWQFRGLEENERFGFLFENLTDNLGRSYKGQVASSIIASSREMYALALDCSLREMQARWQQAFHHPLPTPLVKSAPVKEEIHIGDTLLEHGGLNEFPIPMATNGWEAFPRITAGCWMSKDCETGSVNVGMVNGVVLGPLRTNCRLGEPRDMRVHWNKCKQRGIPLEAALVIGGPPVIPIVAALAIPYGLNELEVAGNLAGQPIPVVRCETVDLEVPATAEVVIEGEIPTDYLELDTPSGENLGYTLPGGDPVHSFRVKAITHRRNPIWHDIICQMPPSESSIMRSVSNEGRVFTLLRVHHGLPQVKDVAFHNCGASRRLCVIRMQDVGGVRTHNAVVWQALYAAMAVSADWPKIAIAVDEDIDPWDLESVFWAMSTRYQPHRDTKIIQGRQGPLDQSSGPHTVEESERYSPTSRASAQGASTILMDATRKWGYTPISLPKQKYMEHARELWGQLGLPTLQPKEPWYGISLGLWPEDTQALVQMAEENRFEEAADRVTSKGIEV